MCTTISNNKNNTLNKGASGGDAQKSSVGKNIMSIKQEAVYRALVAEGVSVGEARAVVLEGSDSLVNAISSLIDQAVPESFEDEECGDTLEENCYSMKFELSDTDHF